MPPKPSKYGNKKKDMSKGKDKKSSKIKDKSPESKKIPDIMDANLAKDLSVEKLITASKSKPSSKKVTSQMVSSPIESDNSTAEIIVVKRESKLNLPFKNDV